MSSSAEKSVHEKLEASRAAHAVGDAAGAARAYKEALAIAKSVPALVGLSTSLQTAFAVLHSSSKDAGMTAAAPVPPPPRRQVLSNAYLVSWKLSVTPQEGGLDPSAFQALLAAVTVPRKLTWKDVIGMEDVVAMLQMQLDPPHLSGYTLASKRRFLLFGPPGTGKSHLVEVFAAEAGMLLFKPDPATIKGSLVGQTEKALAAVREIALQLGKISRAGVVLFFDEVNALTAAVKSTNTGGSARDSTNTREQFLVMMDALKAADAASSVFVFGATNFPDEMDPACLRRFQNNIYVPNPSARARTQLFRKELQGFPHLHLGHFEFRGLAEITEGFSITDISRTCENVRNLPFARFTQAPLCWYRISHRGKFELVDIKARARPCPSCADVAQANGNSCADCRCILLDRATAQQNLETIYLSLDSVYALVAAEHPAVIPDMARYLRFIE